MKPQKQTQIDFLKELSYEEINDMLRHYIVELEKLKAENERLKEERDGCRFYLDKIITEWHAGDTGKVLNHLNYIAAKLTPKD